MTSVTVYLAKALICFAGQCHPALVGVSTPTGAFDLKERQVSASGYGGDVLQFDEDDTFVWAIHRVWTGNPKEARIQRLQSSDPKRRLITNGCINVMPEVYEQLKDCCSASELVIEP